MGGGCAASTIVHDVRTWWVCDAGWSWQRLAGCIQMRVNAHGCMQHVGGKVLARNAWGWLRGCWGVQWLCRWVLDITRSPGKIRGSGGVGTGYDKYEWDNELWMMHNRHIFYSIKSNCVYAGKTAAVANDYESHMVKPYTTSEDCRLYSYLPWGFPMNPQEVKQGVCFINNMKESSIDQVDTNQNSTALLVVLYPNYKI